MGIYWVSYLYHGIMVSKPKFELMRPSVDPKCVKMIAPERWVIHAPGRFIKLGSIDPVLDDNDIRQGVNRDKIDHILQKNPIWYQQWHECQDKTEIDEWGIFICELQCSSMHITDIAERVSYNIRVRNRDESRANEQDAE